MKTLKILTRVLHIKDRKGDISITRFPVLNISVSDAVANIIESRLETEFECRIREYKIEKISEELPGIIYSDKNLYLIESCDEYLLTNSNRV